MGHWGVIKCNKVTNVIDYDTIKDYEYVNKDNILSKWVNYFFQWKVSLTYLEQTLHIEKLEYRNEYAQFTIL